MGYRPTQFDLNDEDLRQLHGPKLSTDLPTSPRPGEAPPALSPLDAFAWQSRLLARRFEDIEDGKRISRIRHADVAKEMANRPEFFKSLNISNVNASHDEQGNISESSEDSGPSGRKGSVVPIDDATSRPMSYYPVFGNAVHNARNNNHRALSTPFETPNEYPEEEAAADGDYFGKTMPRASSPEPMDNTIDKTKFNLQTPSPITVPSLTNSVDSIGSVPPPPRTLTNGSTRSQRSLAPPRSPAYPKSPRSAQSIRSVPQDVIDDDGYATGAQAPALDRKFSGSSSISRSRPQSPLSPSFNPVPRSPSTMSDYSMTGSQRRNFSRPMSPNEYLDRKPSFDSRSSFDTRPSTDLPYRQPSAAGASIHTVSSMHTSSAPPSRQMSEDDSNTPFATPLPFPGPNNQEDGSRPSTSYTYAKFPLPRGRTVERHSRGTRESWIQRQFRWDGDGDTPMELDPLKARERANSQGATLEQPPVQRAASPALSDRISHERKIHKEPDRANTNSTKRSRSVPKTVEKANALHRSSPSVKTQGTTSTDRTIKAVPLHERSTSTELTPDEHLELGIETHSNGELNKSTYHLRLAAMAGLPTGMLLYALACRHGWGMRPNQAEGVMWLRKAIDSAGLEVADVEASLASKQKGDPAAEIQERKKRKAQFALAVYELGISYMNGWGCPKDKPLAVSCFEMAGNWGDCDALAEAAFCYAQGTGCKKDLKKAAALYRKAAEGGMSMAGNSWIYKPKYMDDNAKSADKDKAREKDKKFNVEAPQVPVAQDASQDKEGRATGRARTRSIWGRKKSAAG